ncbi:hypothetical protein FACS1894137_15020 [Spirochaetia bacterium]|nr:hypothetical protein FACS1894137_15020 [Spirochaetia bacterium]
MKLKQVTIQNYKSCKETVIDINDGITALIGINGAGKTNILTAIDTLGEYYIDNTSNESEITAIFYEGDLCIELKIIPADSYQLFYEWRMSDIIPDRWFTIPMRFHIYPDNASENKTELKSLLHLQQINLSNDVFIDEIFTRSNKVKEFLKTIYYYSAALFADPTKAAVSINTTVTQRNPHDKFIFDLYQSKPETFERYTNLIGQHGIHLVDELKKGYTHGNIITPIIIHNNNELSFNQLSEGTFKTLALLFYLINSDDGLILLEEPEICLHYKLLRDVIEIIKNESENKQIIFSTHSDYVLDMLEPEVLVFVENTKDGTKANALSKALSENNYKGLRTFLECEGSLGEYWKGGGFDGK